LKRIGLVGLRNSWKSALVNALSGTFRAGAKAPECAGVIHSDLQRGFIRGEVVHLDELCSLGRLHEAKSAGELRLEGQDYPVKDGDVLEIRFDV
jgi:ribosome-binding ATPase